MVEEGAMKCDVKSSLDFQQVWAFGFSLVKHYGSDLFTTFNEMDL